MPKPIRTSLSHPLQIADLRVADQPGVLGLTFCPGKKQATAITGVWNRDLTIDLAAVQAWGANGVITLVTAQELRELQVPELGKAVQALGMSWWHLPIEDVGVPDEKFADNWRYGHIGSDIRARLRRGDRLLVHCKGGLGRTGLLAAQLLVEFGTPPRDAIAQVRSARPGAIENVHQENYVFNVEVQARPRPKTVEKLIGCLLGGAVGDALGAPIEFMRWPEIVAKFGPSGLHDFAQLPGTACITDDTQMTMFTAEGLIRAKVRGDRRGVCHPPSVVHHAYLRWLETQGRKAKVEIGHDGWLFGVADLHHTRAPGLTCLSALQATDQFGDVAVNTSKGCGGVMRVAPCGFWFGDVANRLKLGADCAYLTHAHPTGYLAAGYLAAVIAGLADGLSLTDALDGADAVLVTQPDHAETLQAVTAARTAAERGPSRTTIASLGQGWIAEEALAIAIYAVLAEPSPLRALALAVNHDGDSDSTGAIAGNILGAMHGHDWIPAAWLEKLELRAEIERLAVDLAWAMAGPLPTWDDYPGW